MKIGVFCQHNGPQSDIHFEIAASMIESARVTMPGVDIWHLTDGKSREIEGVDNVKRLDGEMPMAVRRVSLHASVYGDWCFVDTDIIFQKSVEHVFEDKTFDIALTDRVGTEMDNTSFGAEMPYNMGVTFCRNPAYWAKVRHYLLSQSPQYQEWMGDQMVVCNMMTAGNFGFKAKVLPGRIYNYPPVGEESVEHAAILHYKGGYRKDVMNNQRRNDGLR